jgi:hypothetical protein
VSGRPRARAAWISVAVALASPLAALGACGKGEPERTGDRSAREARSASMPGGQRFPELLNVRPVRTGPRRYDFMVMVSSPYDSPRRYADGWRVLALDGRILGVKRLAHSHPDEQPFWRRHSGVEVPRGARRVLFEGHDSRNGYGGERLTVTLP